MSSVLDCDCVCGVEPFLEPDDEESTRSATPARRGGGGGGAFENVMGGDCDRAPVSVIASSDSRIALSELATGFGLS